MTNAIPLSAAKMLGAARRSRSGSRSRPEGSTGCCAALLVVTAMTRRWSHRPRRRQPDLLGLRGLPPRGRPGLRGFRAASVGQPRPADCSQALATASGALPPATCPTRSASVLVSSFADTASQASFIGWLSTFFANSGTMFCAANMLFGSDSETNPFLAMDGSVEKMSAASMLPFFNAFTVTVPPACVALNWPNWTPYTLFSAGTPSARVLNCAGAPRVSLDAWSLRSAIACRWYLLVVDLVTVIVSLSCAGA